MTQPPYGLPPDRPQDTPRAFPTYGRPDPQRHAQQPSYGQSGPQAPWVAPGQPQQPQAPYGQPYYGQPQQGQGYPAAGQWPAPYGYGYPAASGGGTNGLATAALICGAGGFIVGITAPVAIGLGIAALVQIKNRQQEGKGMAIAGLVLGALVTLGYALIITLAIAFGSSVDDGYGAPSSTPSTVSNYGTTYVDELKVGECFDDGYDEGEAFVKPCADSHDAEIIADVTLPAGPYPGDRAVRKSAQNSCEAEFAKYVGIPADESELEWAYWSPDRELWEEDDDRRVICAAYGPDDEPLTGSVKGTKR